MEEPLGAAPPDGAVAVTVVEEFDEEPQPASSAAPSSAQASENFWIEGMRARVPDGA